jgi:hypothetical protein
MFDDFAIKNDVMRWLDCGRAVIVHSCLSPEALVDSRMGRLVVLCGGGKSPSCLAAFSPDGAELFRVQAPDNFKLYYLSGTREGAVRIVCTTDPPIGHFADWHFEISKTGEFTRTDPAY